MCSTTEFLPAYSQGILDLGGDILVEEHLAGNCDVEGCIDCCAMLFRINPPLGMAALDRRKRNLNQASARSSTRPIATIAKRQSQSLPVDPNPMIQSLAMKAWHTGAILIGHGHSKEWLALERYLERDLSLKCLEFNSEPAAGYTPPERLEAMLDQASFAIVVLTAEDKHDDGNFHARPNVIHEVGLFQGKLGRLNVILLVESGCAMPSNLSGATHISFPSGNIQ
jgi:predicted nucleotide-binding protein